MPKAVGRHARIQSIEKARLAKLAKTAGGDGSVIDLYATEEEKLELARLLDGYNSEMAIHESQWASSVNNPYIGTVDSAQQALDEYLEAPINTSANTPVGGRFQTTSYCQEKGQISSFAKQTGISEDELGLVNRYSYGSKWINLYSYGVTDPYHGCVFDYGGLCRKYIPATNSVLEKLPRNEATV